MKNIKLKNIHTFNNWGTFEIDYKEKTYKAKWKDKERKELETNAPKEVHEAVYNYLFN